MRWKCRTLSCRNYDKCCYVFGNFGHVALNNRTLIKQNKGIQKGLAIVEDPLAGVLGDLIAEQQRGKPQLATAFTGGMGLTLGLQTPGIANYFNIGGSNSASPVPAILQPMSSPPQYIGCDNTNLEVYIDQLITQRPAQAVQLDAAREKLRSDGQGYSKLRKITDAQWERTGIGAGTINTLKERMCDQEGPKKQFISMEEDSDGELYEDKA